MDRKLGDVGFMRLCEFIRTHPDAIEREWEQFARTLTPFAASLSVSTLRDHLRKILQAITDDMASSQTSAQQQEKSEGKAAYGDALDRITTAASSPVPADGDLGRLWGSAVRSA